MADNSGYGLISAGNSKARRPKTRVTCDGDYVAK